MEEFMYTYIWEDSVANRGVGNIILNDTRASRADEQ